MAASSCNPRAKLRSFKSVTATKKEIAAHYDRGNDFFRAFLGPRMVYTSGIYYECPTWTKS